MPLEIRVIPCRTDNYAYLLHDAEHGKTALVDAPEAAPILSALRDAGWSLDQILITHHHTDHVEGVEELRRETGAKVLGAKADVHRLPDLDTELSEGDTVQVGGSSGTVIDVSGHTVGHIAFHFPDSQAVFTADSLMALGCGRLFEGTAPMMWQSLKKLKALPGDTQVYSGHEYTAANAKFALTIEPENESLILRSQAITEARSKDQPTVPALLEEELRTNPFLRADLPDVKTLLDMDGYADADVFAEIRQRKDDF